MTSHPATPNRRQSGPIVGDIDGLTTYYDLMGGSGEVRLKRLLSAPQMTSSLDIAEHVVFLEGASCGLHRHTRTEEIYYLLSGAGTVEVEGERLEVRGGDLIITPLNSVHQIGAVGDTNLAMLVVEVLPGPEARRTDPTRITVRALLADQPASFQGVRVASVELPKFLTGAWGPFQLAALDPGARLGPCITDSAEQFLYLACGHARFEFGDRHQAGKAGLYTAIPPGMPWTIVNDSISNRAEIAITQVGLP